MADDDLSAAPEPEAPKAEPDSQPQPQPQPKSESSSGGVAGVPAKFIEGIKQSEGFAPRAAWDYKQFTSGYGTRANYPGEPIDRDTADQRFASEITKAAQVVDAVNPKLDTGTRAALTSLTFNAGGSWAHSALGERIRAGDIEGARNIFQQYNRAGGAVNPGLVARRSREAAWFGQDAPAGDRDQLNFLAYEDKEAPPPTAFMRAGHYIKTGEPSSGPSRNIDDRRGDTGPLTFNSPAYLKLHQFIGHVRDALDDPGLSEAAGLPDIDEAVKNDQYKRTLQRLGEYAQGQDIFAAQKGKDLFKPTRTARTKSNL